MQISYDGLIIEAIGTVLLFGLIFGMSATVDISCLQSQLKNQRAIAIGVLLQFLLMPFLGLLIVRTFAYDKPTGIALLIVTSSPGGTYSNWWCSIFNADLALSVAMTGISTLLSVIMLPINLLFYANIAYGENMMNNVDFTKLQTTLVIIMIAIGSGLYASYKNSTLEFHSNANRLGNFAGLALIVFSFIMANSSTDWQLWDRDRDFFIGVGAPCVLGLILANIVSTALFLYHPERVTVSIECAYQNVGVAATVALAMFDGDDAAQALGVPFYYGIVEAVIVLLYCLVAWKAGWTKAPTDVSFWKALTISYEVVEQKESLLHGNRRTYSGHQSLCATICGADSGCGSTPNKTLSDAVAEKSDDEEAYCYVKHDDEPTIELTKQKDDKSSSDEAVDKTKSKPTAADDSSSGSTDDGYVLNMA